MFREGFHVRRMRPLCYIPPAKKVLSEHGGRLTAQPQALRKLNGKQEGARGSVAAPKLCCPRNGSHASHASPIPALIDP